MLRPVVLMLALAFSHSPLAQKQIAGTFVIVNDDLGIDPDQFLIVNNNAGMRAVVTVDGRCGRTATYTFTSAVPNDPKILTIRPVSSQPEALRFPSQSDT